MSEKFEEWRERERERDCEWGRVKDKKGEREREGGREGYR